MRPHYWLSILLFEHARTENPIQKALGALSEAMHVVPPRIPLRTASIYLNPSGVPVLSLYQRTSHAPCSCCGSMVRLGR